MSHSNSAVLFLSQTVFFALVSPTLTEAQEATHPDSSEVHNPYSRPKDIVEGRMYMRGYCSICHGPNGTGGRGPDLTQRRLRHGNSDETIFRNIQSGIPGTEMRGFSWQDKRIWQVVSFIREQRRAREPPVLKGDAKLGEKLFEKHKCASCHWTGRKGGRRGPDLSNSRSSLDYVRTAIIDPNADVDRQYQQLVIATTDGRVRQGMRLSENSYYIQFIDEKENLHTISKANIEELRRTNQSLMLSYVKQLSKKELDDLIAHLFSLRKE